MCDKTKEELINIIHNYEKCSNLKTIIHNYEKCPNLKTIIHNYEKCSNLKTNESVNHELKKIKERQRDQIDTLNRYNKKSYELYQKQVELKSMI